MEFGGKLCIFVHKNITCVYKFGGLLAGKFRFFQTVDQLACVGVGVHCANKNGLSTDTKSSTLTLSDYAQCRGWQCAGKIYSEDGLSLLLATARSRSQHVILHAAMKG